MEPERGVSDADGHEVEGELEATVNAIGFLKSLLNSGPTTA
jgi:hypothetical protein